MKTLAVLLVGLAACVGDDEFIPANDATPDVGPSCSYPIFGIAETGCDFAANELPRFEMRRYRIDLETGEVVRGGTIVGRFETAMVDGVIVLRAARLDIDAGAMVEVAGTAAVIIALDTGARIDGELVVDGAVDGAGSATSECGVRTFGFGGQMAGVGGPPGGEVADGVVEAEPTRVRAGCPATDAVAAAAARPGGGLQLSSPGLLTVTGSIRAMGEGGGGGAGGSGVGGAGGGSGGVIVVDASGSVTGALCADGGSGGGGPGANGGEDGQAGESAVCNARAMGGVGAGGNGGDGSGGQEIDGGAGVASGVGAPGGGGGAAGFILVRPELQTSAGEISPPRTDL